MIIQGMGWQRSIGRPEGYIQFVDGTVLRFTEYNVLDNYLKMERDGLRGRLDNIDVNLLDKD